MSDDGVRRDAAGIAVLTLLSRLTGFARVLVVAAVLGTGLLGDVYQSANTVPTLVFELLAGGALQAALVPLFVAARRSGGDAGLARTVGVIGGTTVAALAALAVAIAAAAPLLARALTSAEPVSSVATDKQQLATVMVLIFAPQVVFYGLGMVSAAALQARGRFLAAAIAPAVNNVVVIASYLAFHVARDGRPPSLELDGLELALLAGGTTLAVIAFTSVPLVALVRVTPEPFDVRVSWTDDAIGRVRTAGAWAIVQVAGTLAITAGALVIGNGAPGGVAVYALALAVFLLPYALLAAPIATATLPRLATLHQNGQETAFRAMTLRATARVLVMTGLASVGLALLAWPIARLIVFGEADTAGPEPVAHALIGFAPGLVPYGISFLLSRVLIARGEIRQAAVISIVAALVGISAMVVLAGVVDDGDRAAALALAHSIAYAVSAVFLVSGALRRREDGPVG
jgi:murein biosynthesis integral membrane protein MurJ